MTNCFGHLCIYGQMWRACSLTSKSIQAISKVIWCIYVTNTLYAMQDYWCCLYSHNFLANTSKTNRMIMRLNPRTYIAKAKTVSSNPRLRLSSSLQERDRQNVQRSSKDEVTHLHLMFSCIRYLLSITSSSPVSSICLIYFGRVLIQLSRKTILEDCTIFVQCN